MNVDAHCRAAARHADRHAGGHAGAFRGHAVRHSGRHAPPACWGACLPSVTLALYALVHCCTAGAGFQHGTVVSYGPVWSCLGCYGPQSFPQQCASSTHQRTEQSISWPGII